MRQINIIGVSWHLNWIFTVIYTLFLSTSLAYASSSANEGVLTVKLSATADTKHKMGGVPEARRWKVHNSAQFSVRLFANGLGGGKALTSGEKNNNQAILDKWDKKSDACKGDENCEMQIEMQKLQDPQYQTAMQSLVNSDMVEMASSISTEQNPLAPERFWAASQTDPSPAEGELDLDYVETVYGDIDTTNGDKLDVTCHFKAKNKIKPGSPESKVGALVKINTTTLAYEVYIPVNEISELLKGRCTDNKTGASGATEEQQVVGLIGAAPPRNMDDFTQLLTMKGKANSASKPKLHGRKIITTEWLKGNGGDPVPVKVTLEWQFSVRGS